MVALSYNRSALLNAFESVCCVHTFCSHSLLFYTVANPIQSTSSYTLYNNISLQYKMEAMFLEIYNESLRDLLSSTTQTIEIRKDPQHAGEVYVTNVTPSVVTSQKQVCRPSCPSLVCTW